MTSGPSASEGAEIARNAASAYAFRGLRAVSVLVLTPYLFRNLSLGDFGVYGVLITMAALFNLVETGFTVGLTKYVAEHRSRGDRRELAADLGVCVTLMAGLGVAVCLGGTAVALLAGGLAAGADGDGFRVGLLVLSATMLLRFPLFAYGAALLGYQRFDRFYGAEAAGVLVLIGGSVAAIETGAGVLGLAVAYAASLLITAVLLPLLLARLDPGLPLRPRLGDRARIRRVGGFGGLALVADSMESVAQRIDTLVVAAVRNAAAAAPIVAALRLVGGLQVLVLPFVNLILPMVADLRARGAHEEVRRRFVLATRIALQITLPVALGLAFFAGDVIDLWLGGGAPAITADIVIILMAVQVATLGSLPAGKVLLAAGRIRALTVLASVEGVANLALSIVLVVRFGAIGAVVATLLTTGLIVLLRIPLACRAVGCPARRLAAGALVPALLASTPAIAVMIAVLLALDPGAVRLAAGLVAGWGLAAGLGIAQVGPRRLLGLLPTRRAPVGA
ncbi:MAG: oligosaccharide flippase family protein [Solirubrobacteraceae bacterium]